MASKSQTDRAKKAGKSVTQIRKAGTAQKPANVPRKSKG